MEKLKVVFEFNLDWEDLAAFGKQLSQHDKEAAFAAIINRNLSGAQDDFYSKVQSAELVMSLED